MTKNNMIKRKLIFGILVVVSLCFVTFIKSKVCCETITTTVEQSENVDVAKDIIKEKENQKYEVNFFVLIAKAVFSLLIITGLIYFILRFFLKGQRWMTKQEGLIQIIGTHPLAPNKYIQIVEIGNKLLVLGVSEHNINLLTEIIDKEIIDFIKIQVSKQEDKMQLSFIQHLKNRFRGQEIEQPNYEEKLKFLDKQRERLKKLES